MEDAKERHFFCVATYHPLVSLLDQKNIHPIIFRLVHVSPWFWGFCIFLKYYHIVLVFQNVCHLGRTPQGLKGYPKDGVEWRNQKPFGNRYIDVMSWSGSVQSFLIFFLPLILPPWRIQRNTWHRLQIGSYFDITMLTCIHAARLVAQSLAKKWGSMSMSWRHEDPKRFFRHSEKCISKC